LGFAQTLDVSWYGDGSASVFTISTADQLAGLAYKVNNDHITFLGKTINLTNNINLAAYTNWTPIGIGDTFSGTFNGGNHIIDSLRIDGSFSGNLLGLFGIVENAVLKNIIVGLNINVSSPLQIIHIGGIVAKVDDGVIIDSCVSFGKINLNIHNASGGMAGIVGAIYENGFAQILHCANYAEITAIGSMYVSGIVGSVKSLGNLVVTECFNQGAITVTATGATAVAAGIVGFSKCNSITITDCFNVGDISATYYAGGILGFNDDSPISSSYCYNIGTISAPLQVQGAIVGDSDNPSNCYFDYCQSGVDWANGAEIANDIGKCHTIDMTQSTTYAGWDFSNTWTMVNNAFPYFAWLLDDMDANGNYLFQQTIVVMPTPTVSFSPSIICEGDSLTLTFTGTEDFTISGTLPAGFPTVFTPSDTANVVITGACGQLYRTYIIKVPVSTASISTITFTGVTVSDKFCSNTTGVSTEITVKPKPTFTIASADVCNGTPVNITFTGAASSEEVIVDIVGKNDCEKCAGSDKWVQLDISEPSESAGTYTSNITGTSTGNWTFHVNSLTIGGCTITNPNTSPTITACP
jgi:hypothetical protein